MDWNWPKWIQREGSGSNKTEIDQSKSKGTEKDQMGQILLKETKVDPKKKIWDKNPSKDKIHPTLYIWYKEWGKEDDKLCFMWLRKWWQWFQQKC